MKILGIDQSYTCSGLVIINEGIVEHAEVFNTPKEDDIFKRAYDIVCHIAKMVKEYNITKVNIEGLAFGMRGNATRDLAGLQFMIVSNLKFVYGVEVNIISPKSLKKFATQNGKAKKIEMFEALPEDVQMKFTQEYKFLKTKGLYDVTDAYWLAKYE
jgi:Holliday junction resolvasome RuvABC endonuclease subunit